MLKAAAKFILPGSGLGYDIPDKYFFQEARMMAKHTPDISHLEQYEYQLFFAFDDTQPRHSKFHLLGGDAEFLAPAFTQKRYNFWMPSIPWDPPVAMEAQGYKNIMPNYPPPAAIKGQIFAVRAPAERFISLDTERENGVQFRRERIKLIVPYRKIEWIKDLAKLAHDIEFQEGHIGRTFEKVAIVRAHAYIGIPKYWDKLISAFDWGSVDTFESRNRPWATTYYQYRMPTPKS